MIQNLGISRYLIGKFENNYFRRVKFVVKLDTILCNKYANLTPNFFHEILYDAFSERRVSYIIIHAR